jgi:hypothetical protein
MCAQLLKHFLGTMHKLCAMPGFSSLKDIGISSRQPGGLPCIGTASLGSDSYETVQRAKLLFGKWVMPMAR